MIRRQFVLTLLSLFGYKTDAVVSPNVSVMEVDACSIFRKPARTCQYIIIPKMSKKAYDTAAAIFDDSRPFRVQGGSS